MTDLPESIWIIVRYTPDGDVKEVVNAGQEGDISALVHEEHIKAFTKILGSGPDEFALRHFGRVYRKTQDILNYDPNDNRHRSITYELAGRCE